METGETAPGPKDGKKAFHAGNRSSKESKGQEWDTWSLVLPVFVNLQKYH